MKSQDQEVAEALQAAQDALDHLYDARDLLKSAGNWGLFDIFAGGFFASAIKRSKMKGILQDVDKFNSANGFADRMKGWSLGVSAGIPVAGGTVMVGAAYLDAEAADSESSEKTRNDELTRWIVSAGYDYPFSKRTDVYGVVTYNQDNLKYTDNSADQDPYMFGVMVGLRHRF